MKKSIPYIFLSLLFLSINTAKATDLTFGKILCGKYFYVDEWTSFGFEVRNDSVVTANSYSVDVTVKDSTKQTVYESTVQGSNLKPYTIDTLYTTTSWKPELTGWYSLSFKVNFSQEVNPGNDSLSAQYPVIYTRDTFIPKLQYNLPSLFEDTSNTWAFMQQDPLEPGDNLQSYDNRELDITMNDYSYLAWVDYGKDFNFAHPGYYVTFNAIDSTKSNEYRVNWYPTVNGKNYLSNYDERLNTGDRVYGTDPVGTQVSSTSTVTTESNETVQGDSICALLITGSEEEGKEKEARQFNLDLLSGNLSKEQLGPRLPAGSIRELHYPSAAEISAVLDSMKGKYKEIYFYYTGHGFRGGICSNDSARDWLGYYDLSKKLYATGAKDINVVIDACYSGSAVSSFDNYFGKQTNLTLITACSKDTLSWRYVITEDGGGNWIWGSFFSWNFMKCFGEPNAESGDSTGISLKEAFDWTRLQNPDLHGKEMNSLMDPQIYIHRAEATPAPVVRPRDTDVTIYNDDYSGPTVEWEVEMRAGVLDTVVKDSNVVDMSTYRYWSMDTDLKSGYSLGLEFKYQPQLEYLEIENTIPGILQKDSSAVEWNLYGDTEWDSTKYTIRANNLDKLGDFSIGYQIRYTPVLAEADVGAPLRYTLDQNYPNPFNPATTIRFSMPLAQDVSLKVFDVLGREVLTLVDGWRAAGDHRIHFDASQLTSGLYLLHLNTATFSSTKKMLLQK